VLVDGLVVRFNEVEAVRGVSFAVEAGESFGPIMDLGTLVAQGTPAELRQPFAAEDLDDVFALATGRNINEGGSFRDARRHRRLSRRMG
jgi:hypothetical protein